MQKKIDSPLGGWGVGSKEPTRKDLLLILLQRLLGKYHLVLIVNESKGLPKAPKVVAPRGGAPGELWMAQTLNFGQRILLFLDRPAKNQQAKFRGKCPKTLWKWNRTTWWPSHLKYEPVAYPAICGVLQSSSHFRSYPGQPFLEHNIVYCCHKEVHELCVVLAHLLSQHHLR